MATRIERMDVARLLGTRWLPVGLYIVLIFVLSSIPALSLPGMFFLKDKIVHTVEYAGLGWLVHRAVRPTWPTASAFRRVLLGIAAVAMFGVADEVYQAGTPGRDSSIYDWTADVIGASLGQLWGLAREKRRGAA